MSSDPHTQEVLCCAVQKIDAVPVPNLSQQEGVPLPIDKHIQSAGPDGLSIDTDQQSSFSNHINDDH